MEGKEWITPFMKQCYVASAATINMAGNTMMLAYPSGLVLQLKRPDSEIPVDKSIESWIAAVPSISGLLSMLLAAISIARYGRKITQIWSIITLTIGWLIIVFAHNVLTIMIGRVFHGFGMGSSLYLTPILIAEYTSPRYRGAFMMFAGFLSALNVFFVHTISLYLHWRTIAIICTIFAASVLPIAVCSPESPTWLASRQRYDECRRSFRWLRGDEEEDELAKMIKASENAHEMKHRSQVKSDSLKKKFVKLKSNLTEKSFYKPIFVMIHVYTLGQWGGHHIYTSYVFDVVQNIVGKGHEDHVIFLNVSRVLCSILAIYIIIKMKRRTMFLVLSGGNVAVFLSTAAYTYAKRQDVLSFDSTIIGFFLMHIHTFIIVACTLPMPYVIAGEIFPLKYKSVAGSFTIMFASLNAGIYVKTFPYILSGISLSGTYALYAGVTIYCWLIAYFYLPETKDRTLQEIEEEMTGETIVLDDVKSIQTLIDKPDN